MRTLVWARGEPQVRLALGRGGYASPPCDADDVRRGMHPVRGTRVGGTRMKPPWNFDPRHTERYLAIARHRRRWHEPCYLSKQ